jgi:hypothetical protein
MRTGLVFSKVNIGSALINNTYFTLKCLKPPSLLHLCHEGGFTPMGKTIFCFVAVNIVASN